MKVEFIESDQIVTADEFITQTDSPWGLARTSTRDKLNSSDSVFDYIYDSTAGTGTTVYVIDTVSQKISKKSTIYLYEFYI